MHEYKVQETDRKNPAKPHSDSLWHGSSGED